MRSRSGRDGVLSGEELSNMLSSPEESLREDMEGATSGVWSLDCPALLFSLCTGRRSAPSAGDRCLVRNLVVTLCRTAASSASSEQEKDDLSLGLNYYLRSMLEVRSMYVCTCI